MAKKTSSMNKSTKMDDNQDFTFQEDKTKEILIQMLKEIFQFDKNDLDFGIYRILNIKKKEIANFIEKDLFKIISKEIGSVDNSVVIQEKLDTLKYEIEKLFGCKIEETLTKNANAPKVQEYRKLLSKIKQNQNQFESQEDIFDHIINFFSSYYDNGDFISKQRYSKENKYAIPYNGEEVYLYWANQDQYYIKTAENFTNYSFKAGDWIVHFEITGEDVDIEKANIKDADKKYFIFYDLKTSASNILTIYFGYRGLTDGEKKGVKKTVKKSSITIDYVNEYSLKRIKENVLISAIKELHEKHRKLDGEFSDKTEIEWHLSKYTTKNKSDYFIHKDLKGFLSRELDFYIKNEVVDIDNLTTETEFTLSLKKIKAFKAICRKVIEFLAQIEDFQKKLWEKKKFVLSTDYLITLDYIDEKYYPEILKNTAQVDEWEKLNLIDFGEEKIKNSQKTLDFFQKSKYELNIDFLKNNPNLIIDTKNFNEKFKYQILSEIERLYDNISGFLIKSDNYHGLRILEKTFSKKIKCIYIDPPYNTGGDDFLFKDKYKSSSWLSFLRSRLKIASNLLSEDGFIFISIDDNQNAQLKILLDEIFGENNFESQIIIQSNIRGQTYKSIAKTHEYLLVYGVSNKSQLNELRKEITGNEKQDSDGIYELWGLRNRNPKFGRFNRPNLFYPIHIDPDDINETGYANISINRDKETYIEVLPKNSKNEDSCWRWGRDKVSNALNKKKYSILVGKQKLDGNWDIFQKSRKTGTAPKSIWKDTAIINEQGTVECGKLGLKEFGFPKPTELLKKVFTIGTKRESNIMDFFSGSGTSAHSLIKLNNEDKGKRKFVLIEMADYFDSVIIPRIKKVIFSDEWNDNKPQNNNGSKKQIIKYHYLEQYEDSLQNIDFKIPNSLAIESKNYFIKYMLDFESKENPIFLDVALLDNPFEYQIKIETEKGFKIQKVDLIETFNYIAGIFVDSMTKKKHGEIDYIIVKGHRDENNIIVIWRNKPTLFDPKKDKEFVETEILKDEEFDEILVNGNSLIKKAISLDKIFKKGMFGWE